MIEVLFEDEVDRGKNPSMIFPNLSLVATRLSKSSLRLYIHTVVWLQTPTLTIHTEPLGKIILEFQGNY